jgi:hypothetical protein
MWHRLLSCVKPEVEDYYGFEVRQEFLAYCRRFEGQTRLLFRSSSLLVIFGSEPGDFRLRMIDFAHVSWRWEIL